MKIFSKPLLLVITLFVGSIFSAQLYASESKNGVLSSIQKKAEITIGVSILPPWVMKNKQGELIGFEIDIAKQLARDMGVKVKFKQYQWNEMIPALNKGEVDIIA